MTTYNHAYSVSFALSGSNNADPNVAMREEKNRVVAALLAKVSQLLSDEREYRETIEGWDTYEEVAS